MVAALLFFAATTVHATIYSITTDDGGTGGAGDCTLAEAVQAANSNTAVDACAAGSVEPLIDIIDLSGAGGDIVIASTLNLNSTITINGPATIDGDNSNRIFTVGGSGIAILDLLTLTQGSDAAGPAVMNNDGTLTLAACSLTNNVGTSDGGAIQSTGPQLLPPAYNGGPAGTFLVPPFFFSQDMQPMAPPLGAGDATVCANSPVGGVDQLGNPRPAGGGPFCDMGSLESTEVPVELVSFTID